MVPRHLRLLACALALAVTFVFPVSADHAWGTYHWFRTENPLELDVADNVSMAWDGHLMLAINDWDYGAGAHSETDVIDLSPMAGANSPRRCRPTAGRIEVCSESYGNTGWLGVAQIWVSGSHITQATTKLNDFYFTPAFGYDTADWRQMVVCQELGHTFGLDHQDEDFGNPNLGSCMDYTSSPAGNEHPNAHDFEQLADIYSHFDSPASGGGGGGRGRGAGPQLPPAASGAVPGNAPREWGDLVKSNRRHGMYHLDLGNGQRIFTFVIWA
jgi:hypothetical protein